MSDVLDLLAPGARLARPDLAEQALEGLVRARAYRATTARGCATAIVDILAAPGGERIDQLIFGEAFDVLEDRDGFGFGRARRSGVVGWVELSDLTSAASLRATHRVAVAQAQVLAGPSGGAEVMTLPLNALVCEHERREGAVRIMQDGWIAAAELAALDIFDADPAIAAERLLGAPHSLGGRTALGTDCCGLVQQALYACGRAGPRYAVGQAEAGQGVDAPSRGGLVVWLSSDVGVWGGHSGVMVDGENLIHAAGFHGAVVVESLAEASARYAAEGFAAPVFRRV